MTPLPKRRHSTRRGGKRTAAIKLGLTNLTACKQCGKLIRAHRICHSCGYYNGKQVVTPKTKKIKK